MEQDKLVVSTTPEPSYDPMERLEEMVSNSAKDRLLQSERWRSECRKSASDRTACARTLRRVPSEDTTPESHAEPLTRPCYDRGFGDAEAAGGFGRLEGRSLVSPWLVLSLIRVFVASSFSKIQSIRTSSHQDSRMLSIRGGLRALRVQYCEQVHYKLRHPHGAHVRVARSLKDDGAPRNLPSQDPR